MKAVGMVQPTRVLFVADNEVALTTRAEILDSYAMLEVESTTSVSAALSRLSDGDIDCVLSGYTFPETTGLEFLRTVRAEHGKLPFILFADQLPAPIVEEALREGATDYIPHTVCTTSYDLFEQRIQQATSQPIRANSLARS